MFNRINTSCLLDLVVVDDVTKRFFPVGANLQDDDITDRRVVNLGIIEHLVRVINGF